MLRNRRLIVLLGGAGVLVAAVVVWIVLQSGDGPSPTSSSTSTSTAAPRLGDPILDVPFTDLGPTLPKVLERGELQCGVATRLAGFAIQLPNQRWEGFDVDVCRALAAATLGDMELVEFVPLSAAERWEKLADGTVDVLIRNTSYTQARDTKVDFAPIIFYDGQQLLGLSDLFTPNSTVAELDGLSVCVGVDTTSYLNIADAVVISGAEVELVEAQTFAEAFRAFRDGQCDAVTSDGSALAGERSRVEPRIGAWVIFPPTPFSKEPFAPVVRHNDSCWKDVVTWTVFSLFIADEKGITQRNVESAAKTPPDQEVGLLLGADGNFQTALGLEAEAFLRAIQSVGNYDEIFQRNLAPLGLSREASPNALYQDFGLLYAPPVKPDPRQGRGCGDLQP